MVIGGVFKKDKDGNYLTDKNGDYIIDQLETRKRLDKVFPEPDSEEKQAMDTLVKEFRRIE